MKLRGKAWPTWALRALAPVIRRRRAEKEFGKLEHGVAQDESGVHLALPVIYHIFHTPCWVTL